MLKTLPKNNVDPALANKVLVCWENVHLRSIGEKCLKATGGKHIVMATLCSMQHRRYDQQFAEKVIFGEGIPKGEGEEKRDPTKPSK